MRESDGRFTPVTATQIQSRYRGYVPSTIHFVCPVCHQPLYATAMSYGSIQSPHFRHQRNNPNAQLCERFARGYGGYASAMYQRMPLPMFISESSSSSRTFVVTGGFRSPDQGTLDILSASGARLLVGTREYIVNERRFGKGMTRIPFDQLSLTPMKYISLKNSPLPIESVWGLPEKAHSVMIFTRDIYTGQGKRVRRGEGVKYGDLIYLLAPRASAEYAAGRIPDSKHVGHVQCRLGGSTLQVLSTSIPSHSDMTREVLAIFEAEGIAISEDTSAPQLIWPPALHADGVERTLPGYADAFFATGTPMPGDDRLYIYGGSSMLDDASSSQRFGSQVGRRGYASVMLSDTDLLVTETPGSFEQAVMLESADDSLYSLVRNYDVGFESSTEGVVVRVRLTRPLEVTCTRPNLPPTRHSQLGEWLVLNVGRAAIVRIEKRLYSRTDSACLWLHLPASGGHAEALEGTPLDAQSSINRGRDITLAIARKHGGARIETWGRDKSLAAARRSS